MSSRTRCNDYSTRSILFSEQSLKSIDTSPVQKTYWQAENDVEIQKVTQKAIIHELTQEQTRTIESVVPWFLNAMPVSNLLDIGRKNYFSESHVSPFFGL